MNSSRNSLAEPRSKTLVAAALLAGLAWPLHADAGALDECWQQSETRIEVSDCLAQLETATAAELEQTLVAARQAQAAIDLVVGNDRAGQTLASAQQAWSLYRDLDCQALELQAASGTGAGDMRRACRIDHARDRQARLAAWAGGAEETALPATDAVTEAPTDAPASAESQLPASETPAIEPGVTAAAASESAAVPMSDNLADELLGSAWQVVEIDGEPVAEGVETTLAIAADGSVSGQGGCNRYFGSATITGLSLAMSDLGSTRMACPEPGMSQEDRYFRALADVSSWRLMDDELLLEDLAGATRVRLVPHG